MKKRVRHEVYIFLLSFFFRTIIIFGFLHPNNYLRFLPYQNMIRAEILINTGKVYFPDAWSSYYLFLGLIYQLFKFFGLYAYKNTALVIFNIFIASIAFVILYKIITKITTKTIAFVISLLALIYYPLIYLNTLNLGENLFFFFLIIGFYFLLNNNVYKLLISGFVFGLAVAIRPAFIVFFPFLFVWLLMKNPMIKNKIVSLLFIFFPIGFFLIFFSVINWSVSTNKHFSLVSSNAGVNFAIAQCELKQIKYQKEKEDFWFAPPVFFKQNRPVVTTPNPFYNQLPYFQMGLTCLQKNPFQLINNLGHIGNVFNSVFYPDFESGYLHKGLFAFWKIFIIIFFIFFLLYPVFTKKNRSIYWLFFYFLLSLFLSVYLANIGEERYLVPYFFVILLFGSKTIINIFNNLKLKAQKLYFSLIILLSFIAILLFLLILKQNKKDGIYVNLDKKNFVARVKSTISWLENNIDSNGMFYYSYDPGSHKYQPIEKEHIRNLYAIKTFIDSRYFLGLEKESTVVDKTLAFYLKNLVETKNHAYVLINDSADLTINAFLIRILNSYPYQKTHYDRLVNKLTNAIVDKQNKDGSYQINYFHPQQDQSKILAGEIMFAIMEMYQKTENRHYLQSAQEAYQYYKNDWEKNHFYYIHWLTQSYALLYDATNQDDVLKTIYQMNNWMIDHYQIQDLSNLDLVGAIPKKNSVGVSTAFMLEGLNEAYRLAVKRMDIIEMQKYSQAIAYGNRFINYLQYKNTANPKLKGGIKYSYDSNLITIDSVAHALNAYIKTYDNFAIN